MTFDTNMVDLVAGYNPSNFIPGVDTGTADFSNPVTHNSSLFHSVEPGNTVPHSDVSDSLVSSSHSDYFLPGWDDVSKLSPFKGVVNPDSVFTGPVPDQSYNETVGYLEGLFSSVGQQNALNRLFNAEQAQLNREFNSQEAEKSRNWSERMSNTSYQRAVADLQKAGLNPILAYSQGGSSTPNSATATGQNASYNVGGGDSFSDLLGDISNLISSAASIVDLFVPGK